MGSLGCNDSGVNPNCRNSSVIPVDRDATQPMNFDSETASPTTSETASPTASGDGGEAGDVLESLKCTAVVDDTVPVSSLAETQLMDFDDGETEVLYASGETQVVDFEDETQLADDGGNSIQHTMTHLLDESDNDGLGGVNDTDGTEIFSDEEDSADNRSIDAESKEMGCHQNARSSPPSKVHLALPVETGCSSGSSKEGFTSIRTAALRASGLAARRASKWTRSGSCSNARATQSSEKGIAGATSTIGLVNDREATAETNEKTSGQQENIAARVATKAARKLFLELEEDDFDDHISNQDTLSDLPHIHGLLNDLAGLSYVDSQEPGEDTQANALECVDRFLKCNLVGLSNDVTQGQTISENADPASGVKGPQSLAKKINLKSTFEEAKIFDWDDNCEDEGGGEFFSRNNEVLVSKGRNSCSEPRKLRQNNKKGSTKLMKSMNKEEQLNIHGRIMGLVHSETKSVRVSKKTDQAKESTITRNIMHELDEPTRPCSSSKQAKATTSNSAMPDIPEVGPDTQVAAEAMEALSMVVGLHSDGGHKSHPAEENCNGRLKNDSSNGRYSKRATLLKRTRSKRTRCTGSLFEATKSSVASRTRSENVAEVVDTGKVKRNSKKVKLDRSNLNRNGSSEKGLLNSGGKKREGNVEGPGDMYTAEPIAQRTRKRSDRRLLKRNDKKIVDGTKGTLDDKTSSALIPRRPRKRSMSNHLETAANASNKVAGSPKLGTAQADKKRAEANSRADDGSELLKSKHKRARAAIQGVGNSLYALKSNASTPVNVYNMAYEGPKFGDLPIASNIDCTVELCIPRQKRSKGSSRHAKLAKDASHSFPCSTIFWGRNETMPCSDYACDKVSDEEAQLHPSSDRSPTVVQKSSTIANTTPPTCRNLATEASPVFVGHNYRTPKTCLVKELDRLTPANKNLSPCTNLRKKRDISSIRVLFSHHLDDDVIKQQKKILGRLGVSHASSILDATHFVTDKFLRTRNMLEAIASGKPVVTPLWIESCGQASCFIDEKNYILRDVKKEKEFRFNMLESLARASRHPLLQGRRVLITPNAKPSREIILSLVKAVGGQAMERICRSIVNDDKIPDDLLILSDEKDYAACVPLLQKVAAVYSSELLLHGIISQKLEYDRHRLFMDHVKSTRSTIWVRKDGDQFDAVRKRK